MMNDLIDNKLLKENFRNKNYIYCINTLQNEIKQKLIARVRIFKPEYKYCNLADLKTNCYRYFYTCNFAYNPSTFALFSGGSSLGGVVLCERSVLCFSCKCVLVAQHWDI